MSAVILILNNYLLYYLFFFSSRRRHTRLTCDWSSDVALPIWTGRREFQVGLELGCRAGEIVLVHQRHPELIVRFGVARVRGDRAFELLLRVGDLAGVPENDTLVEHRVGIAAAAGGAGRASRAAAQLHRFRAGCGRFIELARRVVDVGETVVGLGVVGLQFDGLLVRRFGLVVVLLLRLGEGDVVVAV